MTPPLPGRQSRRLHKNNNPTLWAAALVIAALTAAAIFLQQPLRHHPEVVIQTPDQVRVSLLQQGYGNAAQCETVAKAVTQTMQNFCAGCTIVRSHCLKNLSARQQMLLNNHTSDIPVIRIPRGVLIFEAADPEMELLNCREAARLYGGNAQCTTPGSAGVAVALAEASHTQMEFTPSPATLVKLTLFAALVSCLVCGFIVWSERWHARFSHDAVQSGPQKFHAVAVPRIGGIAIACAISATFIGLNVAGFLESDTVQGFALLALAALPAFGGGLAEDLTKKVGVLARLLLTMAAGVLASVLIGATLTRLDVPGLDNLLQYWPLFAIAFTAFAVGGVANSINIIDGYNGLASAYSIIVLAALAWVSVQVGDQVVLLASLTMLGAIAGFLPWNWPRGRIFLGDGGAYLLGFWLAQLGVLLVVRNSEVSPWFPLGIMAYPIWETLFSMYRRKIVSRRQVGQPDAMHLHQLVYSRLIRRSVGSKTPIDQHRRNSAVALYMIPPIALLMLPALLVWHRTDGLLACVGLFGVAYVWLYRRISRRTAKWMIST